MSKVVIVIASRTEQENQLLQRKFEPLRGRFQTLKYVGIHIQNMAAALSEPLSLIAINANEWGDLEFEQLQNLRDKGYRGPVLALAKELSSETAMRIKELPNVVLLLKPFEQQDLLGIVSKMLTARSVAQQVYRRYKTDQDAEVELFGNSVKFQSRVFNLSKGGAYMRLGSAAPLRVGDVVRLKLELANLNRVYTMNARIVWTQKETNFSSQNDDDLGVGVEFIGPGDLQKNMIPTF